jgi:hypothetical protein
MLQRKFDEAEEEASLDMESFLKEDSSLMSTSGASLGKSKDSTKN